MLIGIIIALIIGLVVTAIVANIIQQQKEKQEAERRQEMAKHRAVIEETEHVIANDIGIPISPLGYQVLYRRVLNTLKAMNRVTPKHKDILARIQDVTNKLEANDFPQVDNEAIRIPDNDKILVVMIQALKKYRTILRTEHNKGSIAGPHFAEEDKRIERLQLRINISSQVRRGKMAKNNGMTGSARQYFEKAMATLEAQVYDDDYITNSKAEVQSYLDDIARELSADKAAKKAEFEEEQDNLDALFAPKKKW
ncbi:MAG: hypothetical protein HWE10_02665 [Gammaproteobacteria bacterium]|nr:hypothetical protein [Gammaproteobacteria bacterium]